MPVFCCADYVPEVPNNGSTSRAECNRRTTSTPSIVGLVEDHIAPEGEAAKTRRQLVPRSAHERLRSQQSELLIQLIDPSIRCRKVVLCDVFPDLGNVRCP